MVPELETATASARRPIGSDPNVVLAPFWLNDRTKRPARRPTLESGPVRILAKPRIGAMMAVHDRGAFLARE